MQEVVDNLKQILRTYLGGILSVWLFCTSRYFPRD